MPIAKLPGHDSTNCTESVIRGFSYSTDKSRLDVQYIHQFLSKSYWAEQIPGALVMHSIAHSLCIGIYDGHRQMGFARIITDYATFGYLADVFIDGQYRKRGASKGLMEFIFSLDFVPGLRRFLLATRDAHGLYAQSGFTPLKKPESFMEIHQVDVYVNKRPS